jgi:hypothetical protein
MNTIHESELSADDVCEDCQKTFTKDGDCACMYNDSDLHGEIETFERM